MGAIITKESFANRFLITTWVADWGIYDFYNECYVGMPIRSYREAEIILPWIVDFLYDKEVSDEK